MPQSPMTLIPHFTDSINAVAWRIPMVAAIIGVGLFLMFRLAWMPLKKIGYGLCQLWLGRHSEGVGDISAFRALIPGIS